MLSKRLENLHPYVPGEQPKDRIYIKLNANENPYPPSPSVIGALGDFLKTDSARLGLYPDPESEILRAEIASMLNKTGGVLSRGIADFGFDVTKDMIFCGNGSDEVLSLVYYTFFDSGREIILPEHTYSFYPVYAGYYGVPLHTIALKKDWSLDTEAMTSAAKKADAPTIFANPNAPTGRGLTREEIRKMLLDSPSDRVFIVDEAYVDFGGESAIGLLCDFKNLVVVRTFSKSMSLAGLRLGYVVANPELIDALFTVKNSFNHFPVDVLAQKAGIESCRDYPYYAENARKIAAERDSFSAFLREKGWEVIPSKTNFVFARKDGVAGEAAYRAIKERGILVRHFSTRGIEDYIRITIGTAAQMAALRGAMGDL